MAEAADADGASLGQRVVAALKAAAGGVRRAASPSAGDEEDFWRPGAAEEEAAAPDPEEAERYKGLALDAEARDRREVGVTHRNWAQTVLHSCVHASPVRSSI